MERIRAQFETNVFGLVRMCQLVLPAMRRQGWGRIVNVSSMGGRMTFPGRRRLPRDEARGRGALGCPALRGARLRRRRRRDRAGADQDPVRRDGGRARSTTRARRDDDPYAAVQRRGRGGDGGGLRGPAGRLGGGPETVARTIERAISARRPRTRYKVTPSAHLILAQRRLLPDRAWDGLHALASSRRPGSRRAPRRPASYPPPEGRRTVDERESVRQGEASDGAGSLRRRCSSQPGGSPSP